MSLSGQADGHEGGHAAVDQSDVLPHLMAGTELKPLPLNSCWLTIRYLRQLSPALSVVSWRSVVSGWNRVVMSSGARIRRIGSDNPLMYCRTTVAFGGLVGAGCCLCLECLAIRRWG